MIDPITRRLKKGLRWATDPAYRHRRSEFQRLREEKRYVPGCTPLLGPPLQYVDAASFLSAHRAIFEDEIYAFQPQSNPPRIIDGGANIELATLYWKRQFPRAEVVAFEPDPQVFEVLRWNVDVHQCDGVTLIQKGLWSKEAELEFQPDGADGGHVDEVSSYRGDTVRVPVTRLVPYLDEPVDLLKLDIEGAEVEVMRDAAGNLQDVQHLFVEYHSYVGEEQQVDEILGVLRDSGFRIHIQPELVAGQPFIERLESYGMDHRLNIFAYRV